MATKSEFYIEQLREDVNRKRKDIEAWAAKLVKDPAHELQWSFEVFRDAGLLLVWEEILRYYDGQDGPKNVVGPRPQDKLTAEEKLRVILAEAEERMLKGALYPSSSTSPTSNLMSTYTTVAWARLVEQLRSVLKINKES